MADDAYSANEIVHQPDCAGHDVCGGLFECPGCDRLVGWCMGCGDNMPDHCDDCWEPDDE